MKCIVVVWKKVATLVPHAGEITCDGRQTDEKESEADSQHAVNEGL